MEQLRRIMFVIGLLFCSILAKSQETTSEISGTISEGKSPIPNVIVTAVHVPT